MSDHDQEKKEDPGFIVVDKRGQEREEAAVGEEPARPKDVPPVDFRGFVLSLATSALYHLGLVADPESGETASPNLPVARQTIDTIELLEQKTRGNLDQEEEELLRNLLTELRLRYVEASK